MANSARNKPGQENLDTSVVDGQEVMDKIQTSYEKNKTRINGIVAVVVIAVAGYFGYQKLYQEPNNEKASAMMYFANKYMQVDSVDRALDGDGQHAGFKKVISKYGGTKAGNMAKYYAGVCYLKKGDNKNAIKYLEDFNGKGTLVEYSAMGAIGDAHMNSGNTDKAIEFYKKAGGKKDDALHAPIYLFRAALAYENINKPEEAKKLYAQIRDEYPQSQEAGKVQKRLAMLGVLD